MNKIVVARVLRAAGIPVPATWALGEASELGRVGNRGPLVVKPYDGHRGAGVRVVRDVSELAAAVAERPDGPLLVQEHVPGTGEDLKVYVIGDLVFAVRKPFSSTSFSVPGRPVTVTDDVREIALGCGAALGLGLYGLDVIESPGGPVVVDVNYFPGYKGVPGAAPLLADYVEAYAHGAVPDLVTDHVGAA
jgi:ribosomal protein S6--L-glutamate ligase